MTEHRHNPHPDTVRPSSTPDECHCIEGRIYNNADPTSGQYYECEDCK